MCEGRIRDLTEQRDELAKELANAGKKDQNPPQERAMRNWPR